jgi:hypothetical protein
MDRTFIPYARGLSTTITGDKRALVMLCTSPPKLQVLDVKMPSKRTILGIQRLKIPARVSLS